MSNHHDIQTQIDELSRRQRRLTRILGGLLVGIALGGLLGATTVLDEDVTVKGLLKTVQLAVSREAEFDAKVDMNSDLAVEGNLKVNGSVELRKGLGQRFVNVEQWTEEVEKKVGSLEAALADLKRTLEKQGAGLATVETKISTLDDSVSDLERDLEALKQKAK